LVPANVLFYQPHKREDDNLTVGDACEYGAGEIFPEKFLEIPGELRAA
jgi:hypothetical protein